MGSVLDSKTRRSHFRKDFEEELDRESGEYLIKIGRFV